MFSDRQASKLVLPSMGSSYQAHSDSENSNPLEDGSIPNSNPGGDGSDEGPVDSCPSDCESAITGPKNEPNGDGLIRVGNRDVAYETIENKLVLSLSSFEFSDVKVEGVHRIDYSTVLRRAKLHSFGIFVKATAMSRGGDANVKHAWYGGSKNEIVQIITHGFGAPTNVGINGFGICLSPIDCPIGSVRSRAIEEDGLRHVLLCRVILGNAEVICPRSKQSNPSTEEFDSGVDDLVSPQKYVVWGSRMNTHILPEFMVTFRASLVVQPRRQPRSNWMTFATLITVLSKYLRPDAVESVIKHHDDYKRNVITRLEMIHKVRCIAGDRLLKTIIQRFGLK